MENSQNSDMNEMKIKFGGESHLIESNTLINTLIHFTSIVHETNKGLSENTKRIEVKVKALPEGSFIVSFVFEASNIIDKVAIFFSEENISYTASLITTIGGVYTAAKWLRGKKPSNVEEENGMAKITTENGDVNYFDLRGANIYLNNNTVQEAISKQFETLAEDGNIESFKILDDKDVEIANIENSVFSEIADTNFDIKKNEKIVPETATLYISSLDLELKKKWDFYYRGIKISAKIKDPTYLEKINKGARYGKGDSLEVEMEILQEFNDEINTFINKTYTVTKIIGHTERPQITQLNIEFQNKDEKDQKK